MECNKEEAIRAKDIAQRKMENKDFIGARKIAMKAQQLYPDLDNISQMILVCDVHCSAENRVYGNEKDWYGILKIEQTADEASIRKQFRRLALLLHPDKNRFAGAADAFKLIGDALAFLTDREKRMQYDHKCKPAGRSQAPNVGRPPWVQNNFMNNVSPQFMNQKRQQPQQATQQGFYNNQATRIVCPSCSRWIQYYKHAINKILTCPTCRKSFKEYEMNSPGMPPGGANRSRPAFPQQKEAASQHTFTNASGSSMAFQGNVSNEKAACETLPKTRYTSDGGEGSKPNNNFVHVDSNINKRGRTEVSKRSSKKRKEASESTESCDSLEDDGDNLTGSSFGDYGNQYPRRSTRGKQRVFYSENVSNDEEDGEETVKQQESSCEEILINKQKKAAKENKEIGASVDDMRSFENTATEPDTYVYPDPEFSDFDKNKKEECFAVGQIWAVYDELDGMPRFYALIKKVLSPSFKLQITWLESVPDNKDEKRWVAEGLPASCGKFGLLNSETIENHLMFSHLVNWQNGGRKSVYKIYPRKGETWALFKNWDINWYSDPGNHKNNYEFVFVEVLSDYTDTSGVHVALLCKVKGFTCLFGRTNQEGMVLIPAKELFRFSHRIPSFQMTGKEGPNVPKGSFELDPASLPVNLSGFVDSEPTAACSKFSADVELKANFEKNAPPKGKPKEKFDRNASAAGLTEPSAKSEETTYRNSALGKKDKNVRLNPSCNDAPVSIPEDLEIPEPEFYNFDAEKSIEKFQVGQIWAIYSDEDALPKYYGKIQKIDTLPEVTFHVAWLYPCLASRDTIRWVDKNIPICCGKFMVKKRKTHKIVGTLSFSHQLRVEPVGKKDVFTILPQKGEIWALYKNRNVEMKHSELVNCEYEIVEIAEINDEWTLGVVLELVRGYKSVFKPRREKQKVVSVEILQTEMLRFSHQIPAFCLTVEQGESLQGCWELDPAAVPQYLLCSS
ncbi:DNAJ heat shock N-terminal domain-containing protein [Forsythia ovata]